MNHIANEILDILEDSLMHYGMPRRSGRYPYGSGENPYQHGNDFLSRIEKLKKEGWTETPENIMKEFGLTTTEYRAEKSIASSERRKLSVARAKALKEDGLSATEIGKEMGVNESTVRSWLNADSEARMNQARKTADFIKEQIDSKGFIDVGTQVEQELGVSKEKMKQALAILESEGYPVYSGRIPQATNPSQKTTVKVICPPGTEHKDIYQAFDEGKVKSLNEYSYREDDDEFVTFVYPKSMDSSRLQIRYKEEGGADKDGIVELRRGVADLSLGTDQYAQVRILVDDKKYIKGMAVYSDDLPDGVDVLFNTNKSNTVSKMDVLKNISDDPDNPFGALIKPKGQSTYIDENGEKQLSLINKRASEGDWNDWKDTLPSQFLGKQSHQMAEKQLNLAKSDKIAEYDDIMSLTNPTIKKHLLGKFADECDSAAVHLQAAALPGQKYHVIIPNNTLKDNEVYAPGYESGTKLALIRYPHAGTFEIPICTVNNKNKVGKELLGPTSIDAICINHRVAERLSGADFDGDTVMCIPTHDKGGKVKITSTPPLKGLEGFDPKMSYGHSSKKVGADGKEHYYRNGQEYKIMRNTGNQMGSISNLITDMTLLGASQDKIARAVRHSMVVIDAEKHKLDYKQSELDNGIASLKKEFQTGGASTLLSRSKGQLSVPKRQGSPLINLRDKSWYDPSKPEGSLVYKTADDLVYQVPRVNKKTGEVTFKTRTRTQKSTNMAETSDARTLISTANTLMERIYADYANSMKALANTARKEMVATKKLEYSPQAKHVYKKEVKSLTDKLETALLNAPRERQAQLKTHAELEAKINRVMKENPGMKRREAEKAINLKKAAQQSLTKYRHEVGSVRRSKRAIEITDREWEAIQSGAISESKLVQILNNTDVDKLRERAMPRYTSTLNNAKIARVKALAASNYTLEQIAKKLGVSTSTVTKYLKGAK